MQVGDKLGEATRLIGQENTMNVAKTLLAALALSVAAALPAGAQNYTIKVLAGAPGYDHIPPFMAEYQKIWDKYGLKVEFSGGNYIRSNQMMSIGDFDAGYNQIASAIRYNSAGISNIIVSASSAN